jgi:hypothetical protein
MMPVTRAGHDPVKPIKVCQLCFSPAGSGKKNTILSSTTIHRFLDERASPTPFLYSYLQQKRKKMESMYICSCCDSWCRRQSTVSLANLAPVTNDSRILFAVDRLILSIILPGTYTPPELRITQRLVATIRKNHGRNWLGTIVPPLVIKTICESDIRLVSRLVLKSISIATWQTGRKQSVFGNAKFAKTIRCAQNDIV